jgi:hypothetical protein
MLPDYSHLHENHEWYEYIDITYSEFGAPIINGSTVRVPVRHLDVIAGFSGYEQSQLYSYCVLVFERVISSVREVSEYTHNPQNPFKPTYVIDDGPFPAIQGQRFRFILGGYSYDSDGDMRWQIIAELAHIEDGIKQAYRQ